MDLKKKCIGIIFGGESNEHDVSILSAKAIYLALNSQQNIQRYQVLVFYINKKGVWFSHNQSIKLFKDNNQAYQEFNNKDSSAHQFNLFNNLDLNIIDVWFPVLHGQNGEDGTIQGLLKLTHKPIVGSGILGSSLGMDKIAMKLIFSHLKIPQVKYITLQNIHTNIEKDIKQISQRVIRELNFPVFVKPSNSGSSLGISKVNRKEEMKNALIKASEVDSRILIEEGLDVRELECGIIGRSNLRTSQVGEVSYLSDWYDYETKYKTSNKIKIPAEIGLKTINKIKEYSIRGCEALNIYGFARVDFFLEKGSGKLFINEINTIPGFTQKSMFPMLWSSSGIDIDQLVATLIEEAIEF